MGINLGTTNINKLYLGSTEITKAYLGDTLVYGEEPTPSPITITTSESGSPYITLAAGTYSYEASGTTYTKIISEQLEPVGLSSGYVNNYVVLEGTSYLSFTRLQLAIAGMNQMDKDNCVLLGRLRLNNNVYSMEQLCTYTE